MWGGILIANSTTNYYVFFLLGMLLLSFSSAPESGGVVTFGAPFLLIAIFLSDGLVMHGITGSDFLKSTNIVG